MGLTLASYTHSKKNKSEISHDKDKLWFQEMDFLKFD